MSVVNDQDIEQVAELLKQFQPGFLPYPVFEQIARLVALPIVEFIPLRLKDGNVEVLLIERSSDDPFWPNMLHTPGTVVRATDHAESKQENWPAFKRIMSDELHDMPASNPYYVGSMFHQSKRGAEQAQLYWVEALTDNPPVGAFYQVDALPDTLIDSQKQFIGVAADSFKRIKQIAS
jgi:hypothetical protein